MKLKFYLILALLFSGLVSAQTCDLGNYSSAAILNVNEYPFTNALGITVTAVNNGAPTLNNFTYSCGGQSFATESPAWWLNSASQSIVLTFSVPVTNLSVVVNGTNLGERFYFACNTGSYTLANYCSAGFATINGGLALQCTQSAATGTLITLLNPSGATQWTFSHDGSGSGSRIALLDCFIGTVLPIGLNNFTAEYSSLANVVNLNWNVAEETSWKGFDIEHSADGVSWKNVGYVKGQDQVKGYDYRHTTPVNGENFYRLRQINDQGEFVYSETRSVFVARGYAGIEVYPNPSNGIFHIATGLTKGQLSVVDMVGKNIMNRKVEGNFDLDLRDQPKGVYFIQLVDQNNESHIKKIVLK